MVDRAKGLIRAGDCYQVNLAHTLEAEFEGEPRALLCALLDIARPWHGAYLEFTDANLERVSICSASPELFLRYDPVTRRVVTRPMKGTRPVDARDARADLDASAKDRAELAMIVDLVRNDLSRHARPGSVQVAEPARVLDLPYVHHLVADVACTPVAGDDALLAGLLPAGSITGAPKRRVRAIIDELEAAPRGPYCGAHGWLGRDGCELAVAIRTIAIAGDAVAVHAGSGITADSDGGDEWDEVRAKAAAMAAALGGGV